MISVLVVDDHPLIFDGINTFLRRIPSLTRCDVAYNGIKAIEALEKHPYNIVIMDLQMPVMNGYEATDIILKRFPDTRILIFTWIKTKKDVIELLHKGVHGYVLKNIEGKTLLQAFKQVLQGKFYLSPEIQRIWSEFLLEEKNMYKNVPRHMELTLREKEIIRMICLQMTSTEIATKLHISENTVKNHRTHIMNKLEVNNVIGIVMYAIRMKIYIP